jgi:hypothetical protein
VPSTARSRSADAATITGFLPPISQIAGLGCEVENDCRIDIPTALDPVNVMPSTPPWLTSAEPTSAPPLTMLTTPRGTPASTNARYTRWPDNDPISDGLMMHVLPATSAAPAGPAVSADGKLNGPITAHAPYGRITSVVTSASVNRCIGVSNPSCSRIAWV